MCRIKVSRPSKVKSIEIYGRDSRQLRLKCSCVHFAYLGRPRSEGSARDHVAASLPLSAIATGCHLNIKSTSRHVSLYAWSEKELNENVTFYGSHSVSSLSKRGRFVCRIIHDSSSRMAMETARGAYWRPWTMLLAFESEAQQFARPFFVCDKNIVLTRVETKY